MSSAGSAGDGRGRGEGVDDLGEEGSFGGCGVGEVDPGVELSACTKCLTPVLQLCGSEFVGGGVVGAGVICAGEGLDLSEVVDGDGECVFEEVGGFYAEGHEFPDLQTAVDDSAGSCCTKDTDEGDKCSQAVSYTHLRAHET